jgi:hypothetical protein
VVAVSAGTVFYFFFSLMIFARTKMRAIQACERDEHDEAVWYRFDYYERSFPLLFWLASNINVLMLSS